MVSVSDTAGPNGSTWGGESADELVDLLAKLGVDERQARVLGHIAAHGEARSLDLEEACQLRQPQVSQATTALRDKGWLDVSHGQTSGKGRPPNVYSLGLALEEIVEEVTARRREQLNQELARIERLRSLVADREPADEAATDTDVRGTEAGPRQGQG